MCALKTTSKVIHRTSAKVHQAEAKQARSRSKLLYNNGSRKEKRINRSTQNSEREQIYRHINPIWEWETRRPCSMIHRGEKGKCFALAALILQAASPWTHKKNTIICNEYFVTLNNYVMSVWPKIKDTISRKRKNDKIDKNHTHSHCIAVANSLIHFDRGRLMKENNRNLLSHTHTRDR